MIVIKVLTGNQAVAEAVRLSDVDLITAYPITPQTTIVERLSEFVDLKLIRGRLIRVESEFSALAAAYGAALCGARVFTATSSHGLLFMHEMLWWVAGSRIPMVLAVVTRAIGPPWLYLTKIMTYINDEVMKIAAAEVQKRLGPPPHP
ncbi:MAG: hypothetical protein QXD36_06750, partial [Sulfolobales archaeon]